MDLEMSIIIYGLITSLPPLRTQVLSFTQQLLPQLPLHGLYGSAEAERQATLQELGYKIFYICSVLDRLCRN